MHYRIMQLLLLLAFLCTPAMAGEITGSVLTTTGDPLPEALVYVDAIPGQRFEPPAEPAVVDQRNLMFYPHVMPVIAGTVVDFHNGDLLLHNVFSPSGCDDGFQLGTWPHGESRSYRFDEPCAAVVLCNVHPDMEAYVVVVETPYFALTDEAGRYEIVDIPAGEYTLRVWKGTFRPDTLKVTVSDEGPAIRDFRIAP